MKPEASLLGLKNSLSHTTTLIPKVYINNKTVVDVSRQLLCLMYANLQTLVQRLRQSTGTKIEK